MALDNIESRDQSGTGRALTLYSLSVATIKKNATLATPRRHKTAIHQTQISQTGQDLNISSKFYSSWLARSLRYNHPLDNIALTCMLDSGQILRLKLYVYEETTFSVRKETLVSLTNSPD